MDGTSTDVNDAATSGHVLVAGGDADSRERRETQLRAAGYRVSLARTGFEAIVKASCHVPDLILIDDSIGDIEAAETGPDDHHLPGDRPHSHRPGRLRPTRAAARIYAPPPRARIASRFFSCRIRAAPGQETA